MRPARRMRGGSAPALHRARCAITSGAEALRGRLAEPGYGDPQHALAAVVRVAVGRLERDVEVAVLLVRAGQLRVDGRAARLRGTDRDRVDLVVVEPRLVHPWGRLRQAREREGELAAVEL